MAVIVRGITRNRTCNLFLRIDETSKDMTKKKKSRTTDE